MLVNCHSLIGMYFARPYGRQRSVHEVWREQEALTMKRSGILGLTWPSLSTKTKRIYKLNYKFTLNPAITYALCCNQPSVAKT